MTRMTFFIIALVTLSFQTVISQDNPDSSYDVKQYILDLRVSNSSASISGNVTINAVVRDATLTTFEVDLIDTLESRCYMVVDSAFLNGVSTTFQHQNNKVDIQLTQPLISGELFSVQIYYHGIASTVPATMFNGINIGRSGSNTFAATFSEPDGSRIWWPCKQNLKDKADSVTIYLTTNVSNRTGSNGLLRQIDTLAGGTEVRYKWVTNYPIDYYLISFAAGPYKEIKTFAPVHEGSDSIMIQSFLDSTCSRYQFHLKVIEKTKKLFALYSDLFGDYPFKDEKYGYCISGPGLGAMENQTLTTIGSDAMDTTAVLYYNTYNYWYTAHELGHSWFGDYVTCADWNDLWLNEGFASYVEYIALQNIESQNSADNWMNFAHTLIKSDPGGSVYGSDDDRLVYKKGAAILHILRYEINNDPLFFAVLKNYLNDFKESAATALDFKHVAETTTGLDFTNFFDQWYFGEGYPLFDITWYQDNDTLIITSVQTSSSSNTKLFKTPFDLKIFSSAGDTLVRLYQGSNNEVFKLYHPVPADSIEIDPKHWLIQKSSVHLGIEEAHGSFTFRVTPNPAKDKVNIEVSKEVIAGNTLMSVYNIQGQLVFQKRLKNEKTEIDITRFAEGVYLIKLNNHKETVVSKFVKADV